MKKMHKNGFILIIVLMELAVAGVMLALLSSIAGILATQSENIYLQSCEQNLRESGLTWAKSAINKDSRQTAGKTVKLDIGQMNIPRSSLSITIEKAEKKSGEVQVNLSVGRGRQIINRSNVYQIEY